MTLVNVSFLNKAHFLVEKQKTPIAWRFLFVSFIQIHSPGSYLLSPQK